MSRLLKSTEIARPITQAERVEWALADLLRAIDTLRKAPGEQARVLAVIARKAEYDDAREAEARRLEWEARSIGQKARSQAIIEGLRARWVYEPKGGA